MHKVYETASFLYKINSRDAHSLDVKLAGCTKFSVVAKREQMCFFPFLGEVP